MNTTTLAPGYRNVVTALRLFKATVPAVAELPQARVKTSDWIARQRLPFSGRTVQEERPGWCTFRNSESFGSEVFYVHGGGLVFYSAEDFSSLMEHFAIAGECEVTAFRYPKAPEHSPREIVEAISVLVEQRLAELPAQMPVVFAGDSIGGYIALYLALRQFPRRFTRLVLIYPVLDVHLQRESYAKYGRGYCLNAQMMRWFQSLWHRQDGEPDEFSPFSLTASDREDLPPTVLVSAEADVLRDEAFDWCDYLRAGGAKIEHHHMPNLAHDFCLYAGAIAEARTAVDLIASQFRL
jgi:acetyl esterase/lipase